MSSCIKCKYCISEIDGEVESFGGHAYVANASKDEYCGRGYSNKFRDSNVNCKGFKEINSLQRSM